MSISLTFNPGTTPFPYAPLVLATHLGNIDIAFDSAAAEKVTLNYEGEQLTNVNEVTEMLAKTGNIASDDGKTAAFLALAEKLPAITLFPELVTILDSLDDYLVLRTFLIGHELTLADWAVWGGLKSSLKAAGLLKNNQHIHLSRWFSHIESFEATQDALVKLAEARSNKAKSNKTAGSFQLGLPGAVHGQVVTRFPPEPSGYLHIGHAKAAMLNQYFAKMYNGKLIIRFDDTNPSKEKSEFEETILEDLTLLEIVGDQVSHTSDYFDQLYDLAIKLINSGRAYADDTEQAKMREERMHGIASARRDTSIKDNLARFKEMTTGSTEGQRWCIRAKISADDNNKALRDPVIYRCNVSPHHRTGDKWKVYPTYDFACPVVDSIEGVTHALRTNEYRDRNPQYEWMINALGLRKVVVWDFSRLNFIYTLLSKRKLRWFIEQGLVRGWDDPRFPTVRGIRRRGLTVEALRQYMLQQGPSQAFVSLEWDSIWALNKKVIDPVAPRFWVIEKENMVKLTLNGDVPVTVKQNPKHKKNADVGSKDTVYGPVIFIEQKDAVSLEEGEELTLMDWGNAIIRSKEVSNTGVVSSLRADLHLEGDFRKTEKKITWLTDPATSGRPLVNVTLLDYDYLITKKKLEEDDDVGDVVTAVTEFRVEGWGDVNMGEMKGNEIIQFERKGYYRVDKVTREGVVECVHIPDGKAAGLASKGAPPPAVPAGATKGGSTTTSMSSLSSPSASSGMYTMSRVYADAFDAQADTQMYKMSSIYE